MIYKSETDILGNLGKVSEGFYSPKNNPLAEVHPFSFKGALCISLVELVLFFSNIVLIKWRTSYESVD